MRTASAILLIIVFQITSIMMPYGNFDDNYAIRTIYHEMQDQDPDLNVGEFLFDRLLYIGRIFEHEDDDEMPLRKQPTPFFPIQIQTGSIENVKNNYLTEEKILAGEKPTCFFKENKYCSDYHPAVFHPPVPSI